MATLTGPKSHAGHRCPHCGGKIELPLRAYDLLAIMRSAPDGLTYTQLAERMGITVSQTRGHVARIRGALGATAIVSMGRHGELRLGRAR